MKKKDKEFYLLHSDLCKTLSHPKRQEILNTLREGELTVSQLIDKTGIAQSNLSQHLSLLKSKGVLQIRRESHNVFYSIVNQKIIQAFDLISEVLQERLASQNVVIGQVMGKLS